MSGGEQQMLALGMAMMTQPKWLLLDEPSTGLAPVIVRNVMSQLAKISEILRDRVSSSSSKTCRRR